MEDINQDFDTPIKNSSDELFEMINERISSEKLLIEKFILKWY